MPPLHAGRPSCRRAKRGEGRGAPPSPSGQQAAASKLRAGCGGLSREGGHVGDAQWTDAWPARPQRPAGPGGRAAHTGHRRRWAVAGSRPPEAGGTGLSPAQPALCRDRAGRRSPAAAASPHESSPRWPQPGQPSLAPPSHSGRPRSLPLRGLPCPARPCPALPTQGPQRHPAAGPAGWPWILGDSGSLGHTPCRPEGIGWRSSHRPGSPRPGSRKCGLSAGATSHPHCGPSWLGPPPQAQREGERRAGGPGWGGRGRQDPVLLHNSSLELMLKRSSCRKRTPGEFPLGTPRLSQEPPASVSGFPPSSWLPLLC